MEIDIKQIIGKCQICLLNKSRNHTQRSNLSPIESKRRFQLWEMDYTGPLPLTQNGNKYLLVVQAVPVRDMSALTAAKVILSNVVYRFGVPEQLLSDQGTAFESELVKHLCELLGINKLGSTTSHPSTNGLMERGNKTIKELLRCCLGDFVENRDEHIGQVLFAIRSAHSESTGYSPAMLVYGQDPKFSIDLST
ncbi:Retrovirus-related Pol polyprotein [Thelohanellus kitauei]|uniref:Retrovirus-related Pol polyprotein n=1 Tax=Thelohanellus kitauei TaxID=669202 RepID=A0A0C2I7U8_THEKT|nr:Retrovirus-related Pol polyprotein [Thelohanellus kitauei]